jgi:HSP20 family protein
LLNLQRALEGSLASDWLSESTAGTGTFPPINIFQQGDDFVAIIELPGVSKDNIDVQANDSDIRISGRKAFSFEEGASVHRRERISGVFNRSISFPVQIDPGGLKAEYKDGMLAIFIPRAESDKPRTIKIG